MILVWFLLLLGTRIAADKMAPSLPTVATSCNPFLSAIQMYSTSILKPLSLTLSSPTPKYGSSPLLVALKTATHERSPLLKIVSPAANFDTKLQTFREIPLSSMCCETVLPVMKVHKQWEPSHFQFKSTNL